MQIEKLSDWFQTNKRDLPWRRTKNPYFIWISEIICQQTAVSTAIPYYLSFIEKFPNISSLAEASEDEVLIVWQGLGYYSRARNLHKSAILIKNQFSGKFPDRYDELIKLKGVGEYTAGAVASIAFGEQKPAVDGNVYRILSRIFGMYETSETAQGKRKFREKAVELMKDSVPGDFNQMLMEFGALQCVPKNPDCLSCVINKNCYAYIKGVVGDLPLKKKKNIPKDRYYYYFFVEFRGGILLKKRTENDIWKNLYEFPLIEAESEIESDLLQTKLKEEFFGNRNFILSECLFSKIHKLSHLNIYANFYRIVLDKNYPNSFKKQKYFMIKKNYISHFPVSELIKNALHFFYESTD